MATTHKNVVGAFRKSGIVTWLDEATLVLMVRVDVSYATALRDVDDPVPTRLAGDKDRMRI